MNFTSGFAKLLRHAGPAIPDWQRMNLIGRLYSAVNTKVGYPVRLQEGEYVEWETEPVKAFNDGGDVLVIIPMALGMGPNGYMASGEFVLKVNGKVAIEFRAVKYSSHWQFENNRFYYEVKRKITEPETATMGLGYLLLPASAQRPIGEPLRLSVSNRKKDYTVEQRAGVSDRWFRLDHFENDLNNAVYMKNGVNAVLKGPERATWEDKALYFGDLHSHSGRREEMVEEGETEFLKPESGYNCGIKNPDEYYRYAKYVSQLDFFCMSDHHRHPDYALSPADWQHRLEMVKKWSSPDFVPIPGVELVKYGFGHWNVYFREEAPAYPPYEQMDFDEIKQTLKENYQNAMLIPHQVPTYCCSPLNWDAFDQDLSPLVEIYSHWGSGEYFGNPMHCKEVDVNPECFVDNVLKKGYKLGFIGSTDEHGGAPGDGITFINPVGSGTACVWTSDFSREGIFDALRSRACFATTGARFSVKFTVNDTMMGSTIANCDIRKLQVEVDAPEKVREIVLLKNCQEVTYKPGRSANEQLEWVDESPGKSGDFYYPRIILEDGETAWASPVWLE